MKAAGFSLETAWFGPPPEEAPTLVLLHEGLGCLKLWKDFPERLAAQTGLGVFAYSRAGYGGSDPVPLPRPLTYMHDEAAALPAILEAAGIRHAVLIGHSDGASIAAIHAGSTQDHRIAGLVLMAPHFFVEDVSIASIAAAKVAYETTDLRRKLQRWHGANVDVAFRGWNDAWLDPGFRAWQLQSELAHIRVPLLIIQGEDDQYGTAAQLAMAERECYAPVETLLLPHCRHAPQTDQPAATLAAIAGFVDRVLER